MSDFETIEIPFITIGNQRALTFRQLAEAPALVEFVETFRHCFEIDELRQAALYCPPDD